MAKEESKDKNKIKKLIKKTKKASKAFIKEFNSKDDDEENVKKEEIKEEPKEVKKEEVKEEKQLTKIDKLKQRIPAITYIVLLACLLLFSNAMMKFFLGKELLGILFLISIPLVIIVTILGCLLYADVKFDELKDKISSELKKLKN